MLFQKRESDTLPKASDNNMIEDKDYIILIVIIALITISLPWDSLIDITDINFYRIILRIFINGIPLFLAMAIMNKNIRTISIIIGTLFFLFGAYVFVYVPYESAWFH